MTPEVLKGFILTRIVPPLVAVATTWILGLLASSHFLAGFNFTHDETAKALTEVAVFGVSWVFTFLGAHHALKGTYVPGKRG